MRRIIIILFIAILALSLIACNNESLGSVEAPGPDKTKLNQETKEVVLYFANKEYIETGNEELEKLIPEARVVEYKDILLEEVIIKELIKGPKNDNTYTLIPESAKLLDVEVSDGTVFVNFSQEGLFGSSMQEAFTVAQIVSSLFELKSTERVQFLIDGEKAESLMGHLDIFKPFEK